MYKVGDWVFCEFKLQQIKEMNQDKITSITDGLLEHSGNSLNDRCFSMDLKIKRISDEVEYWSNILHKDCSNFNLNFPDIHRYLVNEWCKMCNNLNDTVFIQKKITELSTWCNSILDRCRDLSFETINGVKIFR